MHRAALVEHVQLRVQRHRIERQRVHCVDVRDLMPWLALVREDVLADAEQLDRLELHAELLHELTTQRVDREFAELDAADRTNSRYRARSVPDNASTCPSLIGRPTAMFRMAGIKEG